jgi:phosphonate transport system substrate-binding protein
MNMLISMISALVLGLGVATATAAETGVGDPAVLRVALLPDENAATIIKDNQSLKTYLEQRVGKPVELVVTTDYSSMIEAMRFGRLELAYFGPLSYILARSKSEIEPFAALLSGGSTTYTSVIVANPDKHIERIEDIKGKDVAFGDPASTSSHLVPRALLLDHGLDAGRDFRPHYVGAHDAVAKAVQNGNAEAGALSRPIYNSLVERGIIDPKKVVVIAETKPIPQYPWTMRSNLDPQLKEKIRQAFYDLKEADILKKFKAQGFAPVTDQDYDALRDTAKILRLDLSKLS